MATTAAHVAAAMSAKARREVRTHFDKNDAFDPAHAVAYDPPTQFHRRQVGSLVGRGILRDTGDGRYWLDRDAERLEAERQRAAAILLLKIVLVAIALSVAGFALVARLR
jgi:hypothetical protein